MTSKKAPNSRRAALPRPSDRTKAFTKDWTRLSPAGRYDMRRLKDAMLLLIANDGRSDRSGRITHFRGTGLTTANVTSAAISS